VPQFEYGVASGEVTRSSVRLWTHWTGAGPLHLSVRDGDHVVTEWTLRTTMTEPFYGGLSRKVPMSLHGASIVRIHDGKITDWSDYYDGLTSRRAALASYFTEWVEL